MTTTPAHRRWATRIALFAVITLFASRAYAGPDDPAVEDARTQAEALAALTTSEAAAVDAATWNVFSKNLIHALRMDNEGVQVAAMQYVIRYNDRLDVDEAAIDVMRIYRNHDDDNVRRMAVVALSRMQSDTALGFLRLSRDYEKSERVKQTIKAVIADHEAARTGPTAKIGV